MPYQDLLSGLVELHVLYHAVHAEFYGLEMLEELERHGFSISPGTLYPLLHRLTHRGYLKSREVSVGRTRRRLYQATSKGCKALAVMHQHVRELIGELEERSGQESREGGA